MHPGKTGVPRNQGASLEQMYPTGRVSVVIGK